MKKIKTVTIGISAHNEEANIGSLLQQIILQKRSNYRLESIVIACDGCTDNTVKIVKNFAKKYKYINVINDSKRLGKIARLNIFYENNLSDIFLSFDADIILSNDEVINEIVKNFFDQKVGLVGGNSLPLKPKTFFENIIYRWLLMWFEMRKNLNKGISVHNHMGCISALSKDFANNVEIPLGSIPDDSFIYLQSRKLGYKFKFAKNALVYYKSVDNLKDFLLQHGRYVHSKQYAVDYFGQWAQEMYQISTFTKIRSITMSFFKDPFFTVCALIFQILLRMNIFTSEKKMYIWQQAKSSKMSNL